MRTLWIAEELGLDYEHVPVAWSDPWLKSSEFRQINLFGSVPTLDHDGFTLNESLAINLYLAKSFGNKGKDALYPDDPRREAEAWRWTLWAQGHLEPWVRQDGGLPVYHGEAAEIARQEAHAGLRQLEETLKQTTWLLGNYFSIADFNVACVLSPSRSSQIEMSAYPLMMDWLKRCYDRPAARSCRARFAA